MWWWLISETSQIDITEENESSPSSKSFDHPALEQSNPSADTVPGTATEENDPKDSQSDSESSLPDDSKKK